MAALSLLQTTWLKCKSGVKGKGQINKSSPSRAPWGSKELLGYLDDVILVRGVSLLVIRTISPHIMAEHRQPSRGAREPAHLLNCGHRNCLYLAHLRRGAAGLSLILAAGLTNPMHSADPINDAWQLLGVHHLVASRCNNAWQSLRCQRYMKNIGVDRAADDASTATKAAQLGRNEPLFLTEHLGAS
jgi:hypothetical protein